MPEVLLILACYSFSFFRQTPSGRHPQQSIQRSVLLDYLVSCWAILCLGKDEGITEKNESPVSYDDDVSSGNMYFPFVEEGWVGAFQLEPSRTLLRGREDFQNCTSACAKW